jgi:cellulose synthase/poly-beta-1,6-N-acetylglucosamine synthase-like glycosyltransferase
VTSVLFWIALGLLLYTYVGFPVLVLVRGRLRRRPYRSADITPSVSVVVAAHNEAAGIGTKVENLLGLEYPRDLLEVVVASDGSDDGTNGIVAAHIADGRSAAARLRLLELPRCGKAAALTQAVEKARGEILVFSDANSLYASDAIRAIVRPFADPAIGGVAGDQRYLSGEASEGAGERGYWSFDRFLKAEESRAGNVISATGAIYAIRRSLFAEVRPDVTDDFYVSTGVIEQGRRLVFEPLAVAYEPVSASAGAEFSRKVRVMTRGLRGVVARRRLLNPVRYGFYAIQLLSHKLLRRLMVLPLAMLLVTSALLWDRGVGYRVLTVAQAALYAAGIAGIALGGTRLGRWKPLAVPAFFCLVNAASVVAVWNVLTGRRIERWQTRRYDGARTGAGSGVGSGPKAKPTGADSA